MRACAPAIFTVTLRSMKLPPDAFKTNPNRKNLLDDFSRILSFLKAVQSVIVLLIPFAGFSIFLDPKIRLKTPSLDMLLKGCVNSRDTVLPLNKCLLCIHV